MRERSDAWERPAQGCCREEVGGATHQRLPRRMGVGFNDRKSPKAPSPMLHASMVRLLIRCWLSQKAGGRSNCVPCRGRRPGRAVAAVVGRCPAARAAVHP
jgi:hypothetical protein